MKNYLLLFLCMFCLSQTAKAQHIIVTNDGYAIRTWKWANATSTIKAFPTRRFT